MNDGLVREIANSLGRRALVAITGGGGKTTLMLALAAELARRSSVVSTTTTKIFMPAPGETEALFVPAPELDELAGILGDFRHITVGESIRAFKLHGVSPGYIDDIYSSASADYVIVEADGAKNRPFKVYLEHEPVLPRMTTDQIVTVGAEVFSGPPGPERVFRYELLENPPRSREEWQAFVVRSLNGRSQYLSKSIEGARKTLFVNKCDVMDERERRRTADLLAESLTAYDVLLLGSLRENRVYDYRRLKEREGR